MFNSNVIESSHIFIAKWRYKPHPTPEYRLVPWEGIKLKLPPKEAPTKNRVSKYLRLFADFAMARSLILDEEGYVIAGEVHYHAMAKYEPYYMPVFIIPGLSNAHKAALRQAYAKRGGYDA